MSDNNETNLENKIEALLFFNADPLSFTKLAEYLGVDKPTIVEKLNSLQNNLSNRGINLILNNDSALLVTSHEVSEIIQKIKKDDLLKDLSKAALETLSIIMYRGPLKRADIDYIRGVNSQFILRLLLIRGLIEKEINPKDERGFLYTPSLELMALLALKKIDELPNFESINNEIDGFLSQNNKEEKDE